MLEAILLGALQGITEFLPISSSAHLVLAPYLFGWQHRGLAFDVALHAGTALAIIFYYRRLWLPMIKGAIIGLYRREPLGHPDGKLAWLIAAGTAPAAAAGAAGEDYIERFLRTPEVIALTLILFGLLLLVAERRGRKSRPLSSLGLGDSIWIGVLQTLALIPGVSRSGITITAGLLRNLDRRASAEFSFLLSAPVILGAALLEAARLATAPRAEMQLGIFAAGTAASAVVGFLVIKYFLEYLRRGNMLPFVIYRLVLGAGVLYWLYST